MRPVFSCNSFGEVEWFTYRQALCDRVKREIHELEKEYILGVDETEYKESLVSQLTLEPIELLSGTEQVGAPRTEQRSYRNQFESSSSREVYVFEVQFGFSGTAELFRVKPSSWIMTSHPIKVRAHEGIVSFDLTVTRQDAQEFLRTKEAARRDSFANLANVNQEVAAWNQGLPHLVSEVFARRKTHFSAENDFFAAINVSPNPKTQGLFTVPTVKRQIIPRPDVSPKKQFSHEPSMGDEMYEDILKVLYLAGQGMERKPSLYRGKQEEHLRDQFLLFLETRYSATTGTGETFNKSGKTDILLKYQDGSNLFVAECKWWSGEADFSAAIDQLFDLYLTWRDSKAALLVFVANKGFSLVLQKIRTAAAKHPYFKRALSDRQETSLAFDFHFPDDGERTVKLAILVFPFV